jgi:hypothetical protein
MTPYNVQIGGKSLLSAFCGSSNEYETLLKHHSKGSTTYTDKFKTLCSVADGPECTLDYLIANFGQMKPTAESSRSADMYISKDTPSFSSWLRSSVDYDKDFEEIYPFRTKKDKNLRNIRATDLMLFLTSLGGTRLRIIEKNLAPGIKGLDYIFVYNFCLYISLCDTSILDFWDKTCLLVNGTWDFVNHVKLMSDYIKTHKKGNFAWSQLVELGCLAGYRNPPVEDFDLDLESKLLATGGDKHDFPWGFSSYCSSHLSSRPKFSVSKLSLREYIASGLWATAGASSIGYIEIRDNVTMKIKKIKCRKNFVLDVEDVDYLVNLTLAADSQTNKTLLKCELGKIRLAVASDLGTYLGASFMVYHAGGCYLDWPGVTLEESTTSRLERMMEIKKELRYKVGVPFDFAKFDHQPQTAEIQAIVLVIINAARNTADITSDFEIVANNVVHSFNNSILLTRFPSDLIKRWKVIGGLMSGHRMTSIIGNGYNSVVSQMVIDCCCLLGESRTDFYLNVQGDDTNLLCRSKRQGLMVVRLFQIFKISFGAGKFSVQPHNTEYLRIWYSPDRTYGYMARTLPNLTQRKPWSNQPWGPAEVMRGIWDKIGILKRRGCCDGSCDLLWIILSKRWADLHHIPVEALGVPTQLGGLGISIWDGVSHITPKIPQLKKLGYKIEPKTSYRADRLRVQAAKLGIKVDINYQKMAEDQLAGVVSADDVPSAAKMNRKAWKGLIAKMEFKIFTRGRPVVSLKPIGDGTLYWDSTTFGTWQNNCHWLRSQTALYGRYSHELENIRSYKLFASYSLDRMESVSAWIRRVYPGMWQDVRRLRAHGHMTEVLDYLGGNINLCENLINNDVKDIYTRFAIKSMNPTLRRQDVKIYYQASRKVLITSFLSSSVYRYCLGSL